MKKLFRTVILGAAAAWAVKLFDRKKQEWSMRPAADIRRTVTQNLPDSVSPSTREKIADKVVTAVKGDDPVVVESTDPPARTTSSPPIPEALPQEEREDDREQPPSPG